jgi:uncharacterized protein (DUF1697 family)
MSKTTIALLRGINIGSHKRIKMADLHQAFKSWGFTNIRTVLATGNVLFEAASTDAAALQQNIEEKLAERFGFDVPVIIRTLEEIRALADADPFQGIEVTPDTRLYITFLSEKPSSNLPIPYESPDKSYRILAVSDHEVCSVLRLTDEIRTTDAMNILEKEFGKNITTRNWNTVLKLLEK